jgi:hypothetical protein
MQSKREEKYKENSLFFLEQFSTFLSSDLSRKALKIKRSESKW